MHRLLPLAIVIASGCGRVDFERRSTSATDATEMPDVLEPFGGFCTPGAVSMCTSGGFQICSDAGTWCACTDPPPLSASCSGSNTWNGCRGTGCSVCTELIHDYPCYLDNHPDCRANSTCNALYFDCNAMCPQPTAGDACVCSAGTAWLGCGGGCSVCSEAVTQYACYYAHHPQCGAAICGASRGACDPRCPPPTVFDRGAAVTGP